MINLKAIVNLKANSNFKGKNIKINKRMKPFLKWVGGKTQLLNEIESRLPKKITNYYEPFLGGGSVLFFLLKQINEGKITLTGTITVSDLNKGLIYTYKNIQSKPIELATMIKQYIDKYDNITNPEDTNYIANKKPISEAEGLVSKESYYYWLRKKLNDLGMENKFNDIEYSALFIIINKLCFRGLYREGPNGFNVPFGHYKTTPKFLNMEEFNELSEYIKDVNFLIKDYKEIINERVPVSGDFIYIDPPYVPENEKSFVKYNKSGFNLEEHNTLFKKIIEINKKKIKFILSNSNVDLVKKPFLGIKEIKIDEIVAKRSINSKKPGSKTKEVFIYN